MPVNNYYGNTFVAFTDISGFKELMKDDKKALEALSIFYQTGYNILSSIREVNGFFLSDCGILFVREGNDSEKLYVILKIIKKINRKMLDKGFMLKTSIAYGNFIYSGKIEFTGIEKNPIYGSAYVKAFLDNEIVKPNIPPGLCRIVKENIPNSINLNDIRFSMLKQRGNDIKHLYFYWNLENPDNIETFEKNYKNSYQLKYAGMYKALSARF